MMDFIKFLLIQIRNQVIIRCWIRTLRWLLDWASLVCNPWVFTAQGAPTNFDDKIPVILKHAEWLIEHKGDYVVP